jgi:galactokinase
MSWAGPRTDFYESRYELSLPWESCRGLNVGITMESLPSRSDSRLMGGEMPSLERFAVISPGRVNLIGEHTDYNDGLVLPMAIEPHIRIEVTSLSERRVVLFTDRRGEPSVDVDLARPLCAEDHRGKWTAYPCGVLAGFQRLGWDIPGFQARISGTLPVGGGLSSSAALEVGVATAVEALCGRLLPPAEKAHLAQRAEHEFAGVPCGIMDPFAVTFARDGHAMLLDCRTQTLRHIRVFSETVSVLIAHSGVKHRLADGEYARRRADCESAARLLGVGSLRDVSSARWAEIQHTLPPLERRRARHVVTENQRVLDFVKALETENWVGAGELMYESHRSLSEDYEVSCGELDLLVRLASRIPGVFGCRMTGGGFGGCVVALVSAERTDEARDALRNGYREATGIDPSVMVTRAVDGARVVAAAGGAEPV